MNKSSNHHQTPSAQAGALQRSLETELRREGVTDAPMLADALGTDMARIFEYSVTEASSPEGSSVKYSPQTGGPESNPRRFSIQQRARIYQRLNQSLADCTNLQLQCRQARWNTLAQDSTAECGIFSEIEDAAAHYADLLATRIRGLGGHPQGTLLIVLERSGLNEYHSPEYHKEADIDAVASALGIIEVSLSYDIEWLLELGDSQSADLLGRIHYVIDHHLRRTETQQRSSA